VRTGQISQFSNKEAKVTTYPQQCAGTVQTGTVGIEFKIPLGGECGTEDPTTTPETGSPATPLAIPTPPPPPPPPSPVAAPPAPAPAPATTLDQCITLCDKSSSIEGTGKVTGGGWIYLTNNTYYDASKVCVKGSTYSDCLSYQNTNANFKLNGKKANYGFNAMFRKGLPMGSTNFDFDGGMFHFHSTTQNTPYKFLEVVDEVHARWMGTGTLATSLIPKKNDYKTGFCFMVAVQDHGEPGAEDTWRIRIWKCGDLGVDPLTLTKEQFAVYGDDEARLVFDTNYVPMSVDKPKYTYKAAFPLPNIWEPPSDPQRWRFNGTNVGELDQNGGGNIQIHLHGKPSKALEYDIDNGTPCECANEPFQGDGEGFVTGGGFIFLDQAYMKNEPEGIYKGVKANFGFNAKWLQGQAQGSTNFDILGNGFHFHSQTGGGYEYEDLEVVCSPNTVYGDWADGVAARWWGYGKVARTMAEPKANDWQDGYMYFVSVQDNGEPGIGDHWRIRIMDNNKGSPTVLFDSHYYGTEGAIFSEDPALCPNAAACKPADFIADFQGDLLGRGDRGGGNIQVHCKGGPPARRRQRKRRNL